MESYLRNMRPPNDYMAFDRLVRAMLFWFDRHKIKEPQMFFELKGREYQGFLEFLTRETGEPIDPMKADFVKSMYSFRDSGV
jgi:hypothetical protein